MKKKKPLTINDMRKETMQNRKILSYIQKLQEIKDEIENGFLECDWKRVESLELRITLSYIRAAINALYLTEGKE